MYYPLDKRDRATGAWKFISKGNLNYNGTNDRNNFRFFGPLPNGLPGNVQWEKGHLIGAEFGGRGGSIAGPKGAGRPNFVPMSRAVNHGAYATIENLIKDQANAGKCVLLETYPMFTPRRNWPTAILVMITYFNPATMKPSGSEPAKLVMNG